MTSQDQNANPYEADLQRILAKEKNEKGLLATYENIHFHTLLARSTKNQAFTILITTLMAVVDDYLSRIPSNRKVSQKSIQRHEELLDAIVVKKKAQAIRILIVHLNEVKMRFQKFIEILEDHG